MESNITQSNASNPSDEYIQTFKVLTLNSPTEAGHVYSQETVDKIISSKDKFA